MGQAGDKVKLMSYEARNASIVDWCSNNGERLLREGGNIYKLARDTDVRIKGCTWCYKDNSQHGNAIDFLVQFEGYQFWDAVKALADERGYTKVSSFDPEKFKEELKQPDIKALVDAFEFPPSERDLTPEQKAELDADKEKRYMVKAKNRVYAYLQNNRKLDKDILDWLIHNRLIRQDNKGNAVFVWYTKDGKAVGGDIRGTSGKVYEATGREYTSIIKGSVGVFGFNLKKGKAKKVIFCEAPIDLISFLVLNKGSKFLCDTLFVSMGGLKISVAENFLDMYKDEIEEVYIAVDNDSKGNEFWEKHKQSNWKRLLPKTKDWNDDLKALRK